MVHVAKTLTSKIRRHTSTDAASRSSWGITAVVPALFTSVSRRPQRSSAASTKFWAACGSAISPCTYTASGSDAATASPSATERTELTTTPAPVAAKDRAVAAPIPLLDPVTMTTWEVTGSEVIG